MEIEQNDKIVLYELQLERTEELSRKSEEEIRKDFEELRNNTLAADERLELQKIMLEREILFLKEKKAPAKLINELIEKVRILIPELEAEHANYIKQALEVWAQEALRRRNLISERNAYLLQQISILKKQRDSLQEEQAEEDPLDYQQAKKEWEEENAQKVADEIVKLTSIRVAAAADRIEARKALEELTPQPKSIRRAIEERTQECKQLNHAVKVLIQKHKQQGTNPALQAEAKKLAKRLNILIQETTIIQDLLTRLLNLSKSKDLREYFGEQPDDDDEEDEDDDNDDEDD